VTEDVSECASCTRIMPLHDVGAYDLTKFCVECIRRYGARNLAAASNAALAVRQAPKKERVCFRCSSPLIEGSTPMCSTCNGVYRDRFGKDVVWGGK